MRKWCSLVLGLVVLVSCAKPDGTTSPAAPAGHLNGPPATDSVETTDPPTTPAAEAAPKPHVVARIADIPPASTLTPDDWPQFRGAARDAIAQATNLANRWPEQGPPQLWQVKLGQGYSSPAVAGDRVLINDYDEATSTWMVRCLNLISGEERWRYAVKKSIRPNHGITRSAPATDGGLIFSIDPKCELHCLDIRDGSLVWKSSLPAAFKSQIPAWYNGQCPLLDSGRLVIGTGGSAILAALDRATGKPLWQTPNPGAHAMSHASVAPVEIAGVRQFTYITLKGALGVDAATGAQLWEFPWQFNTAVPTTPLHLGDGKLLLTSGYHARTVIFQVTRDGDQWTATEVVGLPAPTKGWNSELHTPIVHRGYIFGVGKKQRGLWTCLDFAGKELWTSRRKAAFGMGGYVLADNKFYVLEDHTGTLRMLDATADEYRELGKTRVLAGGDVWAPPVVAHGKLLIRDMGKMVCLDVAAATTSTASAVNSTTTAAH
jgi:outer membrane protein assembly factor BamB